MTPLCLIEGYSTPGNADALAHFLKEICDASSRIETIDLYDLPHLYEILGLEMPPMTYRIADAGPSRESVSRRFVDLVVQDFLLNCIPASRHEPLLKEVSRILKPGGIGIISFTSSESLDLQSAISTEQLQADHRVAWNPRRMTWMRWGNSTRRKNPWPISRRNLSFIRPVRSSLYLGHRRAF